jgi:hypothetical protein
MKTTGITMALLLIGTAASAQSGIDSVLSRLESQGFGRFQIEQEGGQIKIDAYRGRDERELVYDASTGALLSDTIERRDGREVPSGETAGALGGGVGADALLDRVGLGAVADRLRSEGYTAIDAEQENGVVTIEARNGQVERELRYDAATGALLADRVETDDDDDDRIAGGTTGGATGGATGGTTGGTPVAGNSGLNRVLSSLETQGFGRFDIEQERGQIRIDAYRGREERELVYDAGTGALLSDTIERRDGREVPSDQPAAALGAGVGANAVLDRLGLGALADQLRSEGYSRIESEEEDGVVTVEARNGRVERELRYDAATGALLADRVETDDDDDDDRGGASASAGSNGGGSAASGSGRGGDDRGGRGGRDRDDDDDDNDDSDDDGDDRDDD